MQRFFKGIVTLGPLGYLKGSGTLATACAVPLVYATSLSLPLTFLVISFFLWATARSFHLFKQHDPSEVVSDEIIGFFIAMFGIAQSGWAYVVGFLLFRFFDITKIFGIKKVESLPGFSGVVMDDVVAGLYTNLLLRLGLWLFL